MDIGTDEPLIAAAIADITNQPQPSATTRSASGVRMKLMPVDESKLPVRRPRGMLVLPKEQE